MNGGSAVSKSTKGNEFYGVEIRIFYRPNAAFDTRCPLESGLPFAA